MVIGLKWLPELCWIATHHRHGWNGIMFRSSSFNTFNPRYFSNILNALSGLKMIEFGMQFDRSLFLNSIDNIPALFWIMTRRPPGAKPLFEPMMVSLLTHKCVPQPQWILTKIYGIYFIFQFYFKKFELYTLTSVASSKMRIEYHII